MLHGAAIIAQQAKCLTLENEILIDSPKFLPDVFKDLCPLFKNQCEGQEEYLTVHVYLYILHAGCSEKIVFFSQFTATPPSPTSL